MKNFAYYAKAHPSIGIAKIVFNHLLSRYPNKRFGDVCDTTSGGTPNRANGDYYNGRIPWLKSGELNDTLITEYEETITELGLKNSSAKVFPKGTLLVAMYGATAGKTGVLNFDSATNQAVCAVFPQEAMQQEFVFWYLKQQRVDFIEISKGGAQPNISQTVIKNAIIPCPTKKVQGIAIDFLNAVSKGGEYQFPPELQEIRREVDNLLLTRSRFEAAIVELQNQDDYLTQLRQALLREAMRGQLLPQDPNDEPAAVLLKKLRAAKAATGNGGKGKAGALFAKEFDAVEGPFEIPNTWTWCKLKEVVETTSGGTPSRSQFDYWHNGSIPWLKSGELNDGLISTPSEEKITPAALKNSSAKMFAKGTLLMAMYGATAGKLGILGFESSTNQAVCAFSESDAVAKKYLFYVLLAGRKQIVSDSWGQSQPNISQTYLQDYIIPLPPIGEQHRIIAKLEQLLQHCDALKQRIRESRRLAEQLLQTALREALAPPAGTEPTEEAELELAEAETLYVPKAKRGRPIKKRLAANDPDLFSELADLFGVE